MYILLSSFFIDWFVVLYLLIDFFWITFFWFFLLILNIKRWILQKNKNSEKNLNGSLTIFYQNSNI